MSDKQREELWKRIEKRRSDPVFQARLKESMERNKKAFELLGDR
jgi:hypothetical protein